MSLTFSYGKGYTGPISSVDEVGWGCLAGPVVAAAVVPDPALPVSILSLAPKTIKTFKTNT